MTGALELTGAAGLLFLPTSRVAAFGLIVLLLLMVPANVYAARRQLTIASPPASPLWFQLPLQAFWIWALWSARHSPLGLSG